jgi:hypothetical protein
MKRLSVWHRCWPLRGKADYGSVVQWERLSGWQHKPWAVIVAVAGWANDCAQPARTVRQVMRHVGGHSYYCVQVFWQ